MLNFLATEIVDTSPYHPGGPIADGEHFVFNWVLIASIILGGFTALMLLYSMFRFRRKHDDDEPVQVHGNTRLEIFWTAVPLAVFMSIFAVTVSQMGMINDSPAATASAPIMHVTVIGQQFSWTFDYTGQHNRSGNDVTSVTDLYIPADTNIDLQVVSSDPPCVLQPNSPPGAPADQVQRQSDLRSKLQSGSSLADAISAQGCGVNHSLYIPQLGGQINAIPGQTNHMPIIAREGVYYGQCTELCGVGHASMLLTVHALSMDKFQQWLLTQVGK